MPLTGEYEPSPTEWVRDHVAQYEGSGGTEGNLVGEPNWPVIIVTSRGRKTGKIRKFGLMRVEHDGEYALVASVGGAPENPLWYANLKADPEALMIQDGPAPRDYSSREVDGDEYTTWWGRTVGVYPPYAEYQQLTTRKIPILVASPKD